MVRNYGTGTTIIPTYPCCGYLSRFLNLINKSWNWHLWQTLKMFCVMSLFFFFYLLFILCICKEALYRLCTLLYIEYSRAPDFPPQLIAYRKIWCKSVFFFSVRGRGGCGAHRIFLLTPCIMCYLAVSIYWDNQKIVPAIVGWCDMWYPENLSDIW